jgi:tetratricopeptide (TPR) repeat protein
VLNRYNQKEVLAKAYLKKWEIDKALAAFEGLITFNPNSKSKRLVNPRNYNRLAKLYEQTGQESKAIEHYEKFLAFWKDADPGIAEVAEEEAIGIEGAVV